VVVREVPDLSEVTGQIADLWQLLTPQERDAFLPAISLHAYKKNELIYREGQSPDSLLCLLEGKVKIFRDGVGGRSQIMRLMRPGQYFGYRAYLAAEPYVTAAAAFEPSVVCSIPMRLVERAMKNNNGLCLFFVKELSVDLGISDCRMVSLTQKHIRGRLAESLLFLKQTYGTDPEEGYINIYMSREDLANLSNMTTSNAIRTLSNFAAERIIEMDGRKIRLLEEETLLKISRIG